MPSQQTYQRYEGGLVPSGMILHRIASKLGVTIDALLSGEAQKQTEVAGKKVSLAPGETPWGKELEDNTQMTVAIQILCRRLTSHQLAQLSQDVIKAPSMSEKAKVFWVSIFGQWLVTRLEIEEFEKLTPKQKVSVRRSANDQKRADPAAAKEAI